MSEDEPKKKDKGGIKTNRKSVAVVFRPRNMKLKFVSKKDFLAIRKRENEAQQAAEKARKEVLDKAAEETDVQSGEDVERLQEAEERVEDVKSAISEVKKQLKKKPTNKKLSMSLKKLEKELDEAEDELDELQD